AQVPLVEQRQTRREKLAVDHALRQAPRDAKARPLRKFGKRPLDALHVARLYMAGAVAHDDPVDFLPPLERARLARVPDQLGIEAQSADLERLGIDLADQIEIDEAVVERSNQRVGADRRMTREEIVAARRVDDE